METFGNDKEPLCTLISTTKLNIFKNCLFNRLLGFIWSPPPLGTHTMYELCYLKKFLRWDPSLS